jgi:hypothetical protein
MTILVFIDYSRFDLSILNFYSMDGSIIISIYIYYLKRVNLWT